LATGCLVVIILASFVDAPEDKVVFLDVGQGDSILLQDGTAQVLIDGGPGMTVLKRLGEEIPWFDKKIEVLILTHPERDHIEGLIHVLERYKVGLVLMPEVEHDSQLYAKFVSRLEETGVPRRWARAGQRLRAGGMDFNILGPFDTPAAQAAARASLNNASVMTRVDFCPEGATPRSLESEMGSCLSFLLTGDAEKRVERLLVAEAGKALNTDIIKAGHHGSNTSTHYELINAASPKAAVISVGENSYGHPCQEVLDRLGGIPIWRTDEHGSVHFARVDDSWLAR